MVAGNPELNRRLIDKVHRGKGYSEMHIANSTGMGEVFRLIIDSFSYWTFTTNPDDKNKVKAKLDQGLSVLDAIRELADETDAARLRSS